MSRSKPLVVRAIAVLTCVGLAGVFLSSCSGSPHNENSLAPSWLSPRSKTIAMDLLIHENGRKVKGTLREVSLNSRNENVESQSFSFTGTANSNKLNLRFGSKLGRINAKVVGRRMTIDLPGSATATVLVAGSSKAFEKEKGEIQDAANLLVIRGLAKTENSDLSTVAALTTRLSSFGAIVLDPDVALIQQDLQEAEQSYSTAEGNISGDGLFFLCMDVSGVSIAASSAQKGLATFQSDVTNGDQISADLTTAVANLTEVVAKIRDDELSWSVFTEGTASINEIEQAESTASSAQSQWLGQVGQYSSQASTFAEEASGDASAALSLQDSAAPSGC